MHRLLLSRSPLKDDRGAVAILVGALAVVLIGMAAFAVDMGIGYASKRQLSVTSDAAALAGASAAGEQLRTLYPAGQSCTGTVASQLTAKATEAAVDVYNAQLPQGSTGDPTVTVACDGPNAIDVTVTSTASFDSVFSSVLGVDQLNPGSGATARVSGSPAYGGLRPYAICEVDALAALGNTSKTFQSTFDFNNGTVSCLTPAGNWGIVDFDGGSNPTGDIASWTQFGYDGAVTIPDPSMPGDPGANFNSSSITDALDSIVGDTVLFPVARTWQESGGNNAEFDATGVITVKVCGWQISAGKNNHGDCWDSNLADAAPQGTDLILQWRYSAYATSFQSNGNSGADCPLSDPLCAPAVRLYR